MHIVFDIGGSKIRIAKSVDGKSFSNPTVIETPESFDDGMRAIIATVKELAGGEPIDAVAGGIPGPLNAEKTGADIFANLHVSWQSKNIAKTIGDALGAPVFIENDAALAALGEATVGAGKNMPIVAYLGIGTGVGGARIVDGKIDANAHGFEPGHHIMDAGKALFPDSIAPHDFESYVSGGAIIKKTGVHPRDIHDRNMWDELAHRLAYGVYNTMLFWSPDVVVLGGGMIRPEGIPLSIVESDVANLMTAFKNPPKIVAATLGDFGGLYGALELIHQKNK